MSWFQRFASLERVRSSSSSSGSLGRNLTKQYSRRRLQYEQLESRELLATDLYSSSPAHSTIQSPTPSALSWFESFREVPRVPVDLLNEVDHLLPAGIAGPVAPAVGEWIVQLTQSASQTVGSLRQANSLLNIGISSFSIISGLGMEGQLLVRGEGASKAVIESSLSSNRNVQSFSLNQLIEGQSTTPDESDFASGQLYGLQKIDSPLAWDVSVGSSSTVIGVVDTGIDPTHPDLYLNMWLNQGELPPKYLDDDGPKLTDIDGDGLITFYDLNDAVRSTTAPYSVTVNGYATGPNASFVVDSNGNGRIDAIDLLDDANWADGYDDDNNSFFDDLFGVNFRSGGDDPYASNNPSDELGHGTHVAGTIGAIGGNATGVVGVNWQTSLMSLRILDNNNQGDSGAAIRAINYAREMREQYRINANGRVTQGANVRVLNNSWGQPGGYEASLEAAIKDSTESGILFVAAAGNGNLLGQGVDNDKTPFYPSGYDVPGVISVAASDDDDRLASFSNFGLKTVDIAAPGVGIRSTLPGGGYGSANGTSMATPHVSGAAALVWSVYPEATVTEVQAAILSNTDAVSGLNGQLSTGGRLNSSKAINADVFAPAARLISKQDVTTAGGTSVEFTVEYSHLSGIDQSTIGNDDLIATRQWGPADQIAATLKANSIITTTTTLLATYIVSAPGGTWDALDFGDYVLSTVSGKIKSLVGEKTTESREIGRFNVRIQDSSVIYVDTFTDSLEPGTLRSAIFAANSASPSPRTIILDSGRYTIDIVPEIDLASTFGTSLESLGIANPSGWNNESTGDFDILGNVTIVGDINDDTIIDAQGLDRVFKVHATSTLTLSRVTVQGGISPSSQSGGGILSIGNLNLDQSNMKKNAAIGIDASHPVFGGAVASWNGNVSINESWLTENKSDFGGALFYGGAATATVQRSTLDNNVGGGVYSTSSGNGSVENSTLSANIGGYGAIANGPQGGFLAASTESFTPSLSSDGRYVAFSSGANNLVEGDTNGVSDIFVYDRVTDMIERVSVTESGIQADAASSSPKISADGRFVAFRSSARNLVTGDTNGQVDIFVFDRTTRQVERVSVDDAGVQGVGLSESPSISDDGRFVTFRSTSTNLVIGDTNGIDDIFVYDRTTKLMERVSITDIGVQGNGYSDTPSISGNGRYVAFSSNANNLVPIDSNNSADIFVYDRIARQIERVSINDGGTQANFNSSNPSISNDGRYISFESNATNLVSGDTNGMTDVFVFDRTTKLIERVSVSDLGIEGNNVSNLPSISGDGRYVTFSSPASNIVPGDTNGSTDIFLFDRSTKLVDRVSVSNSGVQGNGLTPTLSGDGRYVSFCSTSSNLVAGNTNSTRNVFVYDRIADQIEPITYKTMVSEIGVKQSTIAFTSESRGGSAVYGDVKVNSSLFVLNQVVGDLVSRYDASFSSNNVLSSVPQSSFVSSLKRQGNRPPVHYLISGNPAINSASLASVGIPDQLGQMRVVPDVGAVEALTANVSGVVYVDGNHNGLRDVQEVGLPGVLVSINNSSAAVVSSQTDNPQTSINEDGLLEVSDLAAGNYQFSYQAIPGWSVYRPSLSIVRNQSVQGDSYSWGASISQDGRYVAVDSGASNLVPGDVDGFRDIFVYDQTTKLVERVSVSDSGIQGDSNSTSPSISGDGRYVAFASEATNLVVGDTNGFSDIFVYDRVTKLIERVSVNSAGIQGNNLSFTPSISSNGRYVTFRSNSDNLVPSDTNAVSDIFVYDRVSKQTARVSLNSLGGQSNDSSDSPSISADGRYVTFQSYATNLVSGDTNATYDIFVYDRTTSQTERVSLSNSGVEGNNSSTFPSISGDGRFVTFSAMASNFDPTDTNGVTDIFVFDRVTKLIERVSVSDAGVQGNGHSVTPMISADGRFVTFRSHATIFVPGDSNATGDIFIYDRTKKLISRVSVSDAGVQGNALSDLPAISADGRFITFRSDANNLFPNDANARSDIFIAANPLAPPGVTVTLQAGQNYTDLNLGLVPNPGMISGRVFEDTVVNNSYDSGEATVSNAVVFLDLDGDSILDAGEPTVRTTSDGSYQFSNRDSYRNYSIVMQVPVGFEQVSPTVSEHFAWNVFLPAGGVVTDRNFAIRRIKSLGQSSASSVSGRLYDDKNGNGVYDSGIDLPIVNREVYLDSAHIGVRDSNEPRVLTDSQGIYRMTGLSAQTTAVSTTLDSSLVHVSPLGSYFTIQKNSLFSSIQPFASPQSIASGDFNQDGLLDVAVALGDANKISIRFNNGQGGFLTEGADVVLGTGGIGPTSMVVGQFDNDARLDIAVTASFSKNVIVLLNYNPVTKAFASSSAVSVGVLPIDLVAGQFSGDGKTDLVVLNKNGNALGGTVQVLTNNGSGVFTAGGVIATGGTGAVSLVAGNFTGDGSLDVAVVHSRVSPTNTTAGLVTLLRGNGAGSFVLEATTYQVGAGPVDSVKADFNKDGRDDLAVANFSSNSISILLGQASGVLKVQSSILGTASGAFDITVGDIDNDNDMDVIAGNLTDRNISIFRNIGVDSATGDVRFEPLENVGLGQFPQAQRMPLVVGNFDNDTSGPGGTGTLDIVTIPTLSDTLHTLTNKLVNGAHRVALTGLNSVTGLDFIIKSSILKPSFDAIVSPAPIVEDSIEQTISILGVKKGRATGPALQFTATSSNTSIVPNPTVVFVGGASQATLKYTPVANSNGSAVITVTVKDAGVDQAMGTSDDATFSQTFTVTVLPVNDPPVITIPATTTVTQKAGAVSIANFVTGVGKGGGTDEVAQTLSAYSVSADATFFTVLPTINSAGTLTFTPSTDKSGFTPIVVTLSDNGGIAHGGNDTLAKTVFLEIQPVNDAPSINIGANIVLNANPTAQSIPGFATGFVRGGGSDESSQTILDFLVNTSNPGLFSVLPDISNIGTLTFTIAPGASGTASVSVQVRDSGGIANGGDDLSEIQTFTIKVKAAPTVTWAKPADITFGTLLTATQLNATASVPGTFVYTPALNTRLLAGANKTLSVTFTPTDTENYSPVTKTTTITVNKVVSVINWTNPANISYGTLLSATQLNATMKAGSTAGTLTYNLPLNTRLNAGANQTLSVTFTPNDTYNYATVTKSVTITVNKVTPVVTWAKPANITFGTLLSATQLNATATVPGTFAYTPAIGTRFLAGLKTLSVTFTPTDTVNYNSVTKTNTIIVDKVVATINWSNPSSITYGTLLSNTQLNATMAAGSPAGTLTYTPAINTLLNAGANQTLSVTFTPTDTYNYAVVTKTVTITVLKATPVITWANPVSIAFGTLLSSTQLNATSPIAGSFSYTPGVGALLNSGLSQTLSVVFTPNDLLNYNSVTKTVTINVI